MNLPRIDFYKIFLQKYRYLLYLQVLLVVFLFFIITPSLNIDLSLLGIDREVSIQKLDLKNTFLNYSEDISFKKAGKLAGQSVYTFSINSTEKLKEKEIIEIVQTLAQRLSYRNEKDISLDYDVRNQKIYVKANSLISRDYIRETISSSGNFEILKYNSSKSTSSIDFLSKQSYDDIGIDRSNFGRVTRLALDKKLPDDPAARFEIRITLDSESDTKIKEATGTSDFYGVFSDDVFIGFLQNFADNKYLISGLDSGNDFYSVFGRLKAPIIDIYPSLEKIDEQKPAYSSVLVRVFYMQFLIVTFVIGLVLILLHKYKGLVTVLNLLLSIELAVLIMRLFDAHLSEYTMYGFIFASFLALIILLFYNLVLGNNSRNLYFVVLSSSMVIISSYISFRLIPTVEATFFTPVIFILIAMLLTLLTFNKVLLTDDGKNR